MTPLFQTTLPLSCSFSLLIQAGPCFVIRTQRIPSIALVAPTRRCDCGLCLQYPQHVTLQVEQSPNEQTCPRDAFQAERVTCMLKISSAHCDSAACAFRACSRSLGAVPADFSSSAAQSAAPTVFVNANTRLAKGIISRRKEMTPNLVARC